MPRGDGELDGSLGTDLDATPTTPAGFIDNCPSIQHVNGICKTDIEADATSSTQITHHDVDPWHARYLGTDPGRQVGQHPPQAAAGTAIADGEQFVPWADSQPDRIQLVAADHVDQACLAAGVDVC
jgi:hypothetical protein